MLSSTRASASSSSRLVVPSSENGSAAYYSSASSALQDKGKGRATSPETPNSASSCYSGKEREPRSATTSTKFGTDESPQQRLSPPGLISGTPKTTDSASPLTPPSCLSDSASFDSPWNYSEARGVSIDLGDPFTFDPFTSQQQPYRAKTSILGMRRRPYQSGALPMTSEAKDEARLSRLDRASVFSGLRPSTARSPPPPARLPNESMSSSSKRSFEEAISPINSPLSTDGGINSISQDSTSQGFSSCISSSIDLLRGTYSASASASTPLSQATRRRLSYKRRRAAASSPSQSEGGSSSRLDESLLSMLEDNRSSHSVDGSYTDASRREIEHIAQTWSALRNSFEDSTEVSADNVDLPSSTTQLLQQWWVDTEEPVLSGSQSGSDRSTEAGIGSAEDARDMQADRSEAMHMSPSSTVSVSGSLPGSHTVLRRLQLQEREEEEDVRVQNDPLTANSSDYHDQLMEVFQRMNDRSSQERQPSEPRPPLRSTTMMRSTTQLSENGERLSRSSSRRHEDMADDQSDLGDIISSYMEPDETVPERRAPPSMLPSARAFSSVQTQVRSSLATLSSRVSSLQAQDNATTMEELSRRNHEVLQRYSNPESRVRPRHAGSPTIPTQELHEAADRGQSTSIQASSQERATGESTFHYRPPSSRRPARASSMLSTAQRQDNTDAPLWGEYLLSRGPQSQEMEAMAVDQQIIPALASAEETSNEASQYLSRLSGRLSNDPASLTAARRRIGALDSNGRLRGPTRRQNERWLGMSSGEDGSRQELDNVVSRSLFPRHRMLQSTPSLEEQERVMSTYRQMSFPDPESSIAVTAQQESAYLLNRPPQLPSLRSRSPFELPFVNATDTAASSSADQTLTEPNNGSERWSSSSASGRYNSRPHLRPLTLSSRLGTSSSRRSFRHDWSLSSSNSTMSERRPVPTLRLPGSIQSPEDHLQRMASPNETIPQASSDLLELFEGSRRTDTMMDHLDSLSSQRRRRRSQHDVEQRETLSHNDVDSAASLQNYRLLPVHSHSVGRTLRQRSSSGLHTRRRPTLLEAGSSAVDMELQSRDRFDLDSLMASTREGALTRQEEQASTSTARVAPLSTSSSSRWAARRPASRWDRYMDDVGTSIGIRSIMEAQAQEQPFSSHSFFSSLSRLSGGTLASTLNSEIATNPANYVADDEFALRDTYEGLLQLSAQIGDVRSKSTPAHVIAKLPTCLYTHWLGGSCKVTSLDRRSSHHHHYHRHDHNHNHDSNLDVMYDFGISSPDKGKAKAREDDSDSKDTNCSICLESYSALDTVMSLPCNHAFHENCLVTWLKTARSCPCCRGDVCVDEIVKASTSSLRILPELYF